VVMADDADAELMNLEMLKEHPRTAIFGKQQDIKATLKTGTGEIRLTAYEANALSYEAETTGGVALFSDIYYPGWQCTIDGQPTEVLRANYVLRAVVLPAGKHTIEFRFDPQSLHTTEAIANTSLVALIVLLLALVGWEIYRRRQSKEE